MSKLGIGAILGYLSGNEETVKAYNSGIGKTIAEIDITDTALTIRFTDQTGIVISDDAQSCCEHRYMHTDDDLKSFIGDKLLSAELEAGRNEETEYGECKDSEFLKVQTSAGSFTVVNYNEHNGYYGGFCVIIRSLPD